MKKVILAVALAAVMGAASACSPQLFRTAVGAAVITAAVVGTAHMMAHHDAHYHDQYCGCQRRYHHGRTVYYYNGQWEYYDNGRWYYYGEY